VNDARVDSPTPGGSSSVEAYEEDWYRSLRALAERRRSELEQYEDDEPEAGEETSSDAGAGAAPDTDSVWAVPTSEPASDDTEADAAWVDTSRTDDVEASSVAEEPIPDVSSVVEPPAPGVPPDTPTFDRDAAVDVPNALDATPPPWERVLKPLERIAFAPLDEHTEDDAVSIAHDATPPLERTDAGSDGGHGEPPFEPTETAALVDAARAMLADTAEAPGMPEAKIETEAFEPAVAPEPAAGAHDWTGPPDESEIAAPGVESRLAIRPAPGPEPEPEPEPVGPSLTSRDPAERREALAPLADHQPSAAELETVTALILDPDAEIRRLAVETLARVPSRVEDAVVRRALQDPADEVRAAAVRVAATRGIRDLPTLAPLVDARRSPEAHRTVLELLPKILGEAQLTAQALDPLLLAVARLQPPPDDAERVAMAEIAASIGTTLLIEGLMLPDARRLGAVRLLAHDRSPVVLHALAGRAGDPLEEVRQAGLAAAAELGRIEAEAAMAVGPPDIAALAEDLRNPDPGRVERALTSLAEVDRPDVVAWCRERLAHGDAESVALVASVAAVLDLDEIGVELLTRGASLPPERRRPVVDALAEFPDPSQLAGFLAVVPSDRRADAVRLVWESSGHRVLPDLRSLLADPAVDVRAAVIDIVRDVDDPAFIEAVTGLLARDASAEVRAAAVRTIARTEGELPNIIRAFGDPDPHVRATVVESLPSAPAVGVGPVLAQALTDVDERVRLAAIKRLAGISTLAWSALRRCRVEERDQLLDAFQRTNAGQMLEIALEHLDSPDQGERRFAVEMTGWGGSQAAVEAAIRALGDQDPGVRRAAVGALGRLRDRSAVAALGETLADLDADVRIGAVRALGGIDDEGVLSYLVAALKDPDHRVRETTSHVLTEWSSPAVAKRLAGVLAVPSLRESAADLLRRIGPTSVELLIDVLIQGSAEVRHTVGPLLEQIVGIQEFLGRIDSLEPERRLRAIEALGAIAGPRAVDALLRSLSDPDERIRLRATQLLGDLGDPIAADAVRRLVEDPVPDVAAAARHALETGLDSRSVNPPADGT
jgi:HEAT repeat protein